MTLFNSLKEKIININYLKPLVFASCLSPFVFLVLNAIDNNLGPNPVEEMIRTLGDWGIYFILIGLAITPIRKIFKMNGLIKFRRMLGLFAFFYVCMHFLAYIWFDKFFDVQ